MKRLSGTLPLLFLTLFLSSQENNHLITFSHERGFYFESFELKLSCSVPGTEIRFTINGEDPANGNYIIYSEPIHIPTTSIVKAGAFKNGQAVSYIEAHTFIFPGDVINQPKNIEENIKKKMDFDDDMNRFHEYDKIMDPEVVNNPLYKDSLVPALLSIPSVCIGVNLEDFLEFYYRFGITVKTSIEVLYPDNLYENEQIYCGIKPHSHKNKKRSVRVLFKSKYGESKFDSNILKTNSLNYTNVATSFDHLIFRAGSNESWTRRALYNEATFTRDQWYRDMQILMTGNGVHGTFVHLYINGYYWGLYNLVERPDENFLEKYFGGNDDDWYSISHTKRGTGDDNRFNFLINDILKGDMSEDTVYNKVKQYLDIKNFSDYLILSWYIGLGDWPQNNWWAGINNLPEGKLRFFCWDGEISFLRQNRNDLIHREFIGEGLFKKNYLVKTWKALIQNSEYRMFFADRVQELCFNKGWLSPEEAKKTWEKINGQIRLAIIGESARWGDAESEVPKTRDDNWSPEVKRIKNVLEKQNEILKANLKSAGFFPAIDAPEIEISEKHKKKTVTLKNPNHTGHIYYSLDGSDPREIGGAINSGCVQTDKKQVKLNANKRFILKARIKDSNKWSALLEIPVINSKDLSAFRITEIMFNPDSLVSISGKNFEFVEFQNSSNEPLDISGVVIGGGIHYTVPDKTILYPKAYYVLAEDFSWFTEKYGFEPDGAFKGKLNNKEEKIIVRTPENEILWETGYSFDESNAGTGFSLVPKGNSKKLNKRNYWKYSKQKGGTPGRPEK